MERSKKEQQEGAESEDLSHRVASPLAPYQLHVQVRPLPAALQRLRSRDGLVLQQPPPQLPLPEHWPKEEREAGMATLGHKMAAENCPRPTPKVEKTSGRFRFGMFFFKLPFPSCNSSNIFFSPAFSATRRLAALHHGSRSFPVAVARLLSRSNF